MNKLSSRDCLLDYVVLLVLSLKEMLVFAVSAINSLLYLHSRTVPTILSFIPQDTHQSH